MPGTFLNTHLILTTILRGRIVSPILQLRKLSHRVVKQLVKDTQLRIQAMCTQSPCLSHWALSGHHNFLFALPCHPSGVRVSSHITGENCRMAQRQHQAAPQSGARGQLPGLLTLLALCPQHPDGPPLHHPREHRGAATDGS